MVGTWLWNGALFFVLGLVPHEWQWSACTPLSCSMHTKCYDRYMASRSGRLCVLCTPWRSTVIYMDMKLKHSIPLADGIFTNAYEELRALTCVNDGCGWNETDNLSWKSREGIGYYCSSY